MILSRVSLHCNRDTGMPMNPLEIDPLICLVRASFSALGSFKASLRLVSKPHLGQMRAFPT
jgi:hypothetical protein